MTDFSSLGCSSAQHLGGGGAEAEELLSIQGQPGPVCSRSTEFHSQSFLFAFDFVFLTALQAGIKLTVILLPPCHKYRNYTCVPPHLAKNPPKDLQSAVQSKEKAAMIHKLLVQIMVPEVSQLG